jgi:hypothetical protein
VLDLEARIDATEQAVAALEAELTDASVRQDHALLEATARAHRERQEELAWLLREWEEAGAAAEASPSK